MSVLWERRTHISIKSNKSLLAFVQRNSLRRMITRVAKTVNRIYHAAIYVRLSKEDGDIASIAKAESNSISNQKNLIKDFLKDKDDIIMVSERVDVWNQRLIQFNEVSRLKIV